MKAAVLLLTWRRPHTTRRVIDAIRPFAPDRLYVASDGPIADHADEFAKVADTRALVERMIDWDCRIERLYSDINQGCRLAVSRAITWFFQHEEEGIILEDDCVPHPDFFSYCQILLEHYRDDDRIWCISGNNFQDGQKRGDGSYYFSHYPHCWGWASWRRAWQKHDGKLASWPAVCSSAAWRQSCRFKGEQSWRRQLYDSAYSGGLDAWSVAWMYAKEKHGGLALIASNNLVSNLGWGEDATHTHDQNDPRACMKTVPVEFPLRHAKNLVPDDRADLNYFIRFCRAPSLASRVINKLYRIWRQMWA